MKINWVLSNSVVPDPAIDLEKLKTVGPFWGGWQTWRSCGTDNVICNDFDRAVSLLDRNFQKNCNFYIPNNMFAKLQRPEGVRLFEGAFNADINNKEEIIAMHLAASVSDLVLLFGFDWTPRPKLEDKLLEHRQFGYRILVKHCIQQNPEIQWVLINHSPEIDPEFKNLPNLTQDSISSVLTMLAS